MKTLILVRHAKASEKQADGSDFERPLSTRGKRDAPEMGRRLAKTGVQSPRIMSSPALRAGATAHAFADALDYPRDQILWEPDIYEAPLESLLSILRRQSDRVNNLILVGHNPGLTQLANALAKTRLENLPTAGVYTLTLPIQHWNEVQKGIGKQVALDTPRKTPERG